MNLAERIISRATELGFDLVGIAPAGMALHAKEYADWVTSGFAGEMAYMTRNPDRRSDLRRVLPDAKSVIVVGLVIIRLICPTTSNMISRGLIARYAWGIDYHDVLTPHLKQLAQFVEDESVGPASHAVPTLQPQSTSSGPVLERDWRA
jgi:epoxyqueuosine reductase